MAATRKTSTRTTKKASTTKRTDRKVTVIDSAIGERAYQLFAARGFSHGHDFDDWLMAEKELTKKR